MCPLSDAVSQWVTRAVVDNSAPVSTAVFPGNLIKTGESQIEATVQPWPTSVPWFCKDSNHIYTPENQVRIGVQDNPRGVTARWTGVSFIHMFRKLLPRVSQVVGTMPGKEGIPVK